MGGEAAAAPSPGAVPAERRRRQPLVQRHRGHPGGLSPEPAQRPALRPHQLRPRGQPCGPVRRGALLPRVPPPVVPGGCARPPVPRAHRLSRSSAAAVPDGSQYFVLLIITDGVISDMAQTKEAIVNVSAAPRGWVGGAWLSAWGAPKRWGAVCGWVPQSIRVQHEAGCSGSLQGAMTYRGHGESQGTRVRSPQGTPRGVGVQSSSGRRGCSELGCSNQADAGGSGGQDAGAQEGAGGERAIT